MTFNTWLMQQRSREDSVGVFARAARRWYGKPREYAGRDHRDLRSRWIDFLHGKISWTMYGSLFSAAFNEYLSGRKVKHSNISGLSTYSRTEVSTK